MKLTAKQEKFAQAIADGKNQSDAYRSAYDAGGMKAETIQSKASILIKKGMVGARVDELRVVLESKGLWTREKSVLGLSAIADGDDAKAVEIIAAIKELNSMHGFNAPGKLDIAVTFPRTINVIAGRA